MKHFIWQLLFPVLFTATLSLVACEVPDWVLERPPETATATPRLIPTVPSLATPIDALSGSRPAATITLPAATLAPADATAVAGRLVRPTPTYERPPELPVSDENAPPPTASGSAYFEGWQGVIQRLPAGAQEAFLFQRDSGDLFSIDARDADLRGQFAAAAWTAAKVELSGLVNEGADVLHVESLRELGLRSLAARDLSAFALATASSALPNDEGGSYQAWSAIDGQTDRPWCEGVDGPGQGEWLQLEFSAPFYVDRLELSNGFDQGGYLFESNNRVRSLAIYLNGVEAAVWQLEDVRGMQSLNLGELVPGGLPVSAVRLEIRETIPGWEYDDTCLSEVVVWGVPAG